MLDITVWEFRVRPERLSEFLSAYAPGGDWDLLFRRGEGFLSTELLRDERDETRFLTIDRWVPDRGREQPLYSLSFHRRFFQEEVVPRGDPELVRSLEAQCVDDHPRELEVGKERHPVVDGASADKVPIRPTELVELTGHVDHEIDLARLDEFEDAVLRPFGLLLQKPPRLFVSSCPALFIRYTRSQRPLSRYAARPRKISHALSLVFYTQSLIRRTI